MWDKHFFESYNHKTLDHFSEFCGSKSFDRCFIPYDCKTVKKHPDIASMWQT